MIFREKWYKRLWNWMRGRKPGTLWCTHMFEEPVTIHNGETLTVTYKIKVDDDSL